MKARNKQNITAIVYDRKGRIISMGKNSYVKTHPLQAKFANEVGLGEKIFLHAEIDALVRLKDWKKAHKIVVTRFGNSGEPLLAKPCPVCQRAIEMAGINYIEHT
jgi:tRNA(Arg) A34 adenosine deaminase TadA